MVIVILSYFSLVFSLALAQSYHYHFDHYYHFNDVTLLTFFVYLSLSPSPQLLFNTLRPRQNGRRFVDDTFKRIFLDENVIISIKISLKFVRKGPINNIPALVQITAWRRSGDAPLSEPMLVSLLTHVCVTRPQWVKLLSLSLTLLWYLY